jgi:hypothetical protein
MRRFSVTLLATTIVSLAAIQPSAASPPKATGGNCAIAKGEGAISIKARLDIASATFGELIPVYRVDRTHLLLRPEMALHRHGRPQPAASIPALEPAVALAEKGKVPLRYSENAKDKRARRTDLPGGLEGPVAPVVTGLLLSAYA